MNNLIIYPTFLCNFSCQYCLFKHKISSSELLNIDKLDSYINLHKDEIDNFIVSGGDISLLESSYIKLLFDKLQSFNKKIILKTYPYNYKKIKPIMDNYDIKYDFHYDFLAKPNAFDAWSNLLSFDKPFKITITLSPLLFKYHPNNLLKKLAQLQNLQEVEFVPYYKNNNNQFDITNNNLLNTMIKLILSCKLNLPFNITNKEKIYCKLSNNFNIDKNIYLFSNGLTYQQYFDNDILKFKESDGFFSTLDNLNIPDNVDIYSNEICEWFKTNA